MYTEFAEIYDRLTEDVDYAGWADFIESAFLKFGEKPERILELGCGTGNLTLEMARRGYDLIGLDLSVDMLGCASQKSREAGRNILFINQDMRKFALHGPVDSVICTLDSLNYLTRPGDLEKVFRRVNRYLRPGGLFIFDINSAYKLRRWVPSQTFYDLGQEITWIWNSTYNRQTKVTGFELTFFVREENGSYNRFEEFHEERAHGHNEIKRALKASGLTLLATFEDHSFHKPGRRTERLSYIVLKED